MKMVICKVYIFLLISCFLNFSTCFAHDLPITNMNVSELIEKTNAILSIGNMNFRCTKPTPIGLSKSRREKQFLCFFDSNNPTINERMGLTENLSGETLAVLVSASNNTTKLNQQNMLIGAVLLACGLSYDESNELVRSMEKINYESSMWSRIYEGNILSHKLNRYYILRRFESYDSVDYVFLASDNIKNNSKKTLPNSNDSFSVSGETPKKGEGVSKRGAF